MKILVICQYYYPEPFRITDICEELVKKGHDVTVVTGTPNYPMGEIYSGYEDKSRQDEIINGVTVHRCHIHPRKTGALHRLWNYYSYSFRSKRYINRLDSSFDVVFINQLSPVMMANAGIKYAKKYNKCSVLYCLDLWPASLAVGGINKGIMYNWFHRVSNRIYHSVDKILVSSKSFSKYFEDEFGLSDTTYLPQYSEEAFTPDVCKKTPNENIDLMFAGNVGTAQSVDTVIRAAALCKDIQNLRWHIVGDGKELYTCKKLAEKLDVPVIFHGRKPIGEMPKYYAMADAMIVTMQKDPIISLTLPGKVQSYMAAGKPIIGAIDGETAIVLNEAQEDDYCGPSENCQALADNVIKLINSPKRVEIGNKNREYYLKTFSKGRYIKDLISHLTKEV